MLLDDRADSEKYYLLDGKLPQTTLFDDLAGVYKTHDGYVRLHTNFPQCVPTIAPNVLPNYSLLIII